MGVILGSGVCPIALAITWKKANKWGCIGGAIAGFVAGVVAWLVTTAKLNPAINVVTSGGMFLRESLWLELIYLLQVITKCWPEILLLLELALSSPLLLH